MLIILFGLAGSGKTFIGNILAKHFNYEFLDADKTLSHDMHEYIQNKISFTQAMRDEFTQITINKISDLIDSHQNVVISNALYKEKNRQEIFTKFPDALFIYVKADAEIISQRLKARGDKVDEEYATKIAVNFEEPILAHYAIKNNENAESIIKQLEDIFSDKK